MKATICIPARMTSARLPGKPLLDKTGKPLLLHVVEQVKRCHCADRIIIVTPDAEIIAASTTWGVEVYRSEAEHRCGTSRICEAASAMNLGGVIFNIQVDQPEVDPIHIDMLANRMAGGPYGGDGRWPVGTLACQLANGELEDRHVVKVSTVRTLIGEKRALYFSRGALGAGLRHLGVYAFERYALSQYYLGQKQSASKLQEAEDLEQMPWIEGGWMVLVVEVPEAARPIDTVEDYEKFVKRYTAATTT